MGALPVVADLYCRRLGLRAAPPADLDGLRGMHAAHVARISFNDIDCAVGRIPSLALDTLAPKLLIERRGGWCHEHVTLFLAMARVFGFDADALMATMRSDGLCTHALVLVRLAEGDVICDVGLGTAPLQPLALIEQPLQPTAGGWRFGLRRSDDQGWELLVPGDDGAATSGHRFDLAPAGADQLAEGNRLAATDPGSPFPGRLVAVRRRPGVQLRLINRALETSTPDGETDLNALSPGEALASLAARFDVSLTHSDHDTVLDLLTRSTELDP